MNKLLPILLVVGLASCSNMNREDVYMCNGISPAQAVKEGYRLDFIVKSDEVIVGTTSFPITSEDDYTITVRNTLNKYSYVKFYKNDETLLDKQTNVTTNKEYRTMYQCRKL
tara:strand:- start:334 stop:669 length:336 start_codon:yes stop_codon:yes gene_type:complete